jgi:thiamine-phosphate pyrophosphorylase
MRGLYAIVDVATLVRHRYSVVDFTRALVEARPAALQLRAKDLAPRETLHLLRALHPICRSAGVPLFANDRADLAALAGCEGVHVGQEDMPIATIRRIAPTLKVGVSTHNPEQARRALEDRPDYIALGPIYATTSKSRPDPVVGVATLHAVAASSPVPVVGIGGIDLERAPEVARASHLGAVIAGLIPGGATDADLDAVSERARALHALLAAG